MNEHLSSNRYEPPLINLENKNDCNTLEIDLIGSNKNILEIGTSTGYVSKILKDHGNTITGIEKDPKAGLIAERYCKQMIISDVERLDLDTIFELSSFDIILLGDVLEHLKNPKNLLTKLKKFLKPDGYLVVSLPNFCHGDVILNLLFGDFRYTSKGLLDDTHLRFFGLTNIYQIFAECGYQISNMTTTNLPIGGTELKLNNEKIPSSLLDLIHLLPNSDVYQFVFTAHPSSDIIIPDLNEINLHEIIRKTLEKPIHEIRSDLMMKITDRDQLVYNLQKSLDNKNSLISKQSQDLDSSQRILNSFYSSTSWAILKKCGDAANFVFPHGKRRRSFYEYGNSGLRILIQDGWRSLGFKAKNLFLRKYFKSSNPPLIDTSHLINQEKITCSLEKPLKGAFIFPTNQLNEVKFFTATHQRKNSSLILTLKEKLIDGLETRKITIPGSHILDNDFTTFQFRPIENSSEKKYYFELKSIGSPAASIWLFPETVCEEVQLFGDDGEQERGIGFQCLSKIKILDPYEKWIIKNEPHGMSLDKLKYICSQYTNHPKISIITPVWNTEEIWLRRAIDSVIGQIYDNWELCLVDGGSTRSHILPVLKEYAKKDPRIKISFLEENKGIAGNSNEALCLASGEFVGFLDHDDELAPIALCEVVTSLNRNPDLKFIYSDEDKIDDKGKRKDPFFKPNWSPDMLLSYNYLCHFSVIKKTVVDLVEGFHSGYDGSQDYDLFLRVTEKIRDDEIFHIPKILYHWRMIQGSTASDSSAKSYAFIAAKKALQDALVRRHIDGKIVEGLFPSSYRTQYQIKNDPKVSIIIPTKDNVQILQRCINSIIEKTRYLNYEIVVVDNQSKEIETFEFYNTFISNRKIRLLRYESPFNFSAINNYAVTQINSPYILFLNNDTEVISEEWLSAMLEHAQRTGIGAVGAKLLYPNHTIQHAGVIIGLGRVAGHSHKYYPDHSHGNIGRASVIQNVSAVTAACLLMKKEIFEKIGGFDENLAIAFNDVDLCLRIRESGYLIVYTPYAKLFHHESLSRGKEDTPEKQQRFAKEVSDIEKRWGNIINKGDPYYNKNLTNEREDFSLRP